MHPLAFKLQPAYCLAGVAEPFALLDAGDERGRIAWLSTGCQFAREPIVLVLLRSERLFGLLQCHYQSRMFGDERIYSRFVRVKAPQLLGIAHWALRPDSPPFHFGTVNGLVAFIATLWQILDTSYVIGRASVQGFDFSCMSFEDIA